MTAVMRSVENIHLHRSSTPEPPTETNEDVAAMSSCVRLFHKQDRLSISSMTGNGHAASASSLADVIETDYLQRWDSDSQTLADEDNSSSHQSDQRSKGMLTESEANLSYGTFEEQLDKECWDMLFKLISKTLHQTFTIHGHQYNVVSSRELLKKISADILRMSQNEPLGIHGCSLHIRLEREGAIVHLCELQYDPTNECTFEIILSLKEDEKHWYGIDNLITLIPAMFCCRHSLLHVWVCVGRAYKLEKVKLYTSHHTAR